MGENVQTLAVYLSSLRCSRFFAQKARSFQNKTFQQQQPKMRTKTMKQRRSKRNKTKREEKRRTRNWKEKVKVEKKEGEEEIEEYTTGQAITSGWSYNIDLHTTLIKETFVSESVLGVSGHCSGFHWAWEIRKKKKKKRYVGGKGWNHAHSRNPKNSPSCRFPVTVVSILTLFISSSSPSSFQVFHSFSFISMFLFQFLISSQVTPAGSVGTHRRRPKKSWAWVRPRYF